MPENRHYKGLRRVSSNGNLGKVAIVGLLVCVLATAIVAGKTGHNLRLTVLATTADEPAAERNSPSAVTSEIDAQPTDEWSTVKMRVTAYCPCGKCCGEYADGVTACGHRINQGDTFVAADKRFGFGTEMLIPGYNHSQPVKVLDRGGAIRGNRLDVFFNTHQQALEWGVQYLDVKVRTKAGRS